MNLSKLFSFVYIKNLLVYDKINLIFLFSIKIIISSFCNYQVEITLSLKYNWMLILKRLNIFVYIFIIAN